MSYLIRPAPIPPRTNHRHCAASTARLEKYASSYDDIALEADLALLRTQSADTAYVFFNNDIHGYAPWNAMRMPELLE